MHLTTFKNLTIYPALLPADDKNPFVCPASSSRITFDFENGCKRVNITLTEYKLLYAFMNEKDLNSICLGNLNIERIEDVYIFRFDNHSVSVDSVELRAALTECSELIAAFRNEFFDLKLAYKISDMMSHLDSKKGEQTENEKEVTQESEAKKGKPIATKEVPVKRKLYIRQIDQLKSADYKLTCVNTDGSEYLAYAKAADTKKMEKWEPFFDIYKRNKENGNLTTLNCDTATTEGGYIVIKDI